MRGSMTGKLASSLSSSRLVVVILVRLFGAVNLKRNGLSHDSTRHEHRILHPKFRRQLLFELS